MLTIMIFQLLIDYIYIFLYVCSDILKCTYHYLFTIFIVMDIFFSHNRHFVHLCCCCCCCCIIIYFYNSVWFFCCRNCQSISWQVKVLSLFRAMSDLTEVYSSPLTCSGWWVAARVVIPSAPVQTLTPYNELCRTLPSLVLPMTKPNYSLPITCCTSFSLPSLLFSIWCTAKTLLPRWMCDWAAEPSRTNGDCQD